VRPGIWQVINFSFEIMEALRTQVDFVIGENQPRMSLGDAFPFGKVAKGSGDIYKRAEKGFFPLDRVIAKDSEVFAARYPITGKPDIDSTLVVHAHAIPALSQGEVRGCEVVKLNFGPLHAFVAHLPMRDGDNGRKRVCVSSDNQ
jgi:hypothetical protein